jgi:hypothetical protein
MLMNPVYDEGGGGASVGGEELRKDRKIGE